MASRSVPGVDSTNCEMSLTLDLSYHHTFINLTYTKDKRIYQPHPVQSSSSIITRNTRKMRFASLQSTLMLILSGLGACPGIMALPTYDTVVDVMDRPPTYSLRRKAFRKR